MTNKVLLLFQIMNNFYVNNVFVLLPSLFDYGPVVAVINKLISMLQQAIQQLCR